jgi:hypothetical protein
MVKKSGIKPFVYATIIAARVAGESSKIHDDPNEAPRDLEVDESGYIRIEWEVTQEGVAVSLTISPHVKYVISAAGHQSLEYMCDFEVNFDVTDIYGFKAKDGLPQSAVAPYVDFSMFLAREHAAKSIRSAGLSKFNFPGPIRSRNLPYHKGDLPNKESLEEKLES